MTYSFVRLFTVILLSIFLGEWMTMVILNLYSDNEYPLWLMLMDSSILAFLVFPFLYLFHYRPLRNSFYKIKRIERSLREKEERFRKIFDNSPLGISLLSQEWKYVDVNAAMEKIVGFSKEEFLGNTPAMITHPKFIGENMRLFEELVNGKRTNYSIEKKYIRKDNVEIWCKLSVSLYSQADPETTPFYIAMMENITERKAVEKKLMKSQAMLADAEKLANIGHWHWNGKSCETTWSEHMFRIMGFEMSSVVPSEEEQKGAYAGNDWSEVLECREQVYKKGISKTFEAVLKDKGSGEKRILINVRAERDQLDNITGVFGTCQDITLIKQTEDRLKKAKEEAEKTTRLKDKFVSLVAHDLQGPSTANVNLVQLILQDNETPARPEHQEILTNILQSSHKMNLLVKDVLNIGRLKTGNIQLKKRYVNAWKLVEQVLTHLMIKTNSKGVHFFNNIPEDAMIFVDKVLLSQVLENILTNALKFCTRGDTVDIFQPAGETSSLAVRDTGSGMAEQTLKNLFSYELGSSIKGTAGEVGTGLGLPLANDIVSAHGGEIRVETKLGEGSLFVLQLPLLKPLVLIVDDEKIFIEEQKIHLRELDIDVIEAGNGREALNILEKRKPQLIITDVKMPYMGGMEFLEEVRANPETTRIPVIVVTGFEGMGIRDQAFKTGADDFVAKPFDSDELIPRVKRFVSA